MSHNYSMPTIKTLFGQALHCAYPGCAEPLIFEDRNAKTVVAEIAHIRSEKTNGPRYDPTYTGDINGPENLLLLCGKHHAPVDRHESIYPIKELLIWKQHQVSTAGAGTPITTDEAKRFTGLTTEERQAMTDIARLTSRVERACSKAQDDLNLIENERRAALRRMQGSFVAYELNEDGTDALNDDGTRVRALVQMSPIEASQWRARAGESLRSAQPAIASAIDKLDEEVNVLRMMTPALAFEANRALLAASNAAQFVGSEEAMTQAIATMHAAVHDMWLAANPDS